MKNFGLIAAFGLALVGCASTPMNYMPTTKQISEPEIGSVNVASLGDRLLVQGKVTQRDALYVPTTQKTGLFTIHSGYFPKSGETAEYAYFSHSGESGAGKLVDFLGMQPPMASVLAVRKADNALCTINGLGSPVGCKSDLNFELKNWITTDGNSFQQTLLYNGKVGNKINIAYREFSSDLARPAFNNDVEYDLSESNQIGYKGAILEVLEANNQMIKYKVVKNFNTQ